MVAEAGLILPLWRAMAGVFLRISPVCGARKNHRAYAFPRFFRPLHCARVAPPATGGAPLAYPTSYARRTHTPNGSCEACCHNQKRTPSEWMVFFFGCGGRTRTYDLRVMSPTSFQLLYSAIWGALLRCLGIVPRLSRFVKMFFLQSFGKGCRVFPELAS